MSSGIVHTRASVLLAIGFAIGGIVFQENTLPYVAGAVLGTALSPDIDVDDGFVVDRFIGKHLGRFPLFVWRSLWHYYRKSVKHGSELSHLPVLGTTFRLIYLFLFLIVLPYVIMSLFFPFHLRYEFSWWAWLILARWKILVGLMAADTHHYFMDIATSNDKFDLGSLIHMKTNYHKKQS